MPQPVEVYAERIFTHSEDLFEYLSKTDLDNGDVANVLLVSIMVLAQEWADRPVEDNLERLSFALNAAATETAHLLDNEPPTSIITH